MTHEEMLALEVGDMVHDCKNRWIKVKRIYPVIGCTRSIRYAFRITPFFMHPFLERIWQKEIVDKDVIVEDGMECSAIHCCGVTRIY